MVLGKNISFLYFLLGKKLSSVKKQPFPRTNMVFSQLFPRGKMVLDRKTNIFIGKQQKTNFLESSSFHKNVVCFLVFPKK